MNESIPSLDGLKIFADGAALAPMLELARNPRIAGFTTNPTLMRKAGISDYRGFAREVLAAIRDKPISFEVFADEWPEMKRQAREIATWGDNVYVKVPITNTRGEPAAPLIRELTGVGVKLNVTAICTLGAFLSRAGHDVALVTAQRDRVVEVVSVHRRCPIDLARRVFGD